MKNESAFIYGKVPPQSIELEAAVLGAIIMESECLNLVAEILTKPEIFYKEQHRLIYEAIQDTVRYGCKVDILTVIDQLRKSETLDEVGGAYAITMITMNIVSSAHVVDHARKIHHYWQCREIIRVSGEGMQEAYEPDADASKIGETISKAISGVLDSGDMDGTVHAGIVAGECMETIEKAMNNPGMLTGVDTGFRELNKITNGWQKHAVTILAARPSQGKTALALELALNADKPVLFFSLEMSKHELVERMLSSLSGVPLESIKNGTLSHHQFAEVQKAMMTLNRKNILIDDKAGLNTINIQSRLRRWKRKKNIGIAIIDYLQLIQGTEYKGNKNREVVVAEISRSLKLAAKENNIPLIALSQMNREVEKTKRRPQLSDLRESGAIEQDADIVMFIWHEEDPNEGRIKNKLVIAKNRNGKVDDIELKFIGATQRWRDNSHFEDAETFNPYAGMPQNNHHYFEPDPF